MARTEKKTKIRYLPPKAQLTQRDSVTGSFPTVVRTAVVDNRDGRNRSFYDDSNTQVFSNTSVPVMSTPVMSESFPSQFKLNPGQELQPFRDSGQEAADGKGSSDPFWSTGSDFDGLRDPLWSKHKIEIDITPQTPTTITATQFDGYGAIYNFETKQWDKGAQKPFSALAGNTVGTHNPVSFGFTPSYNVLYTLGLQEQDKFFPSLGQPFSNFGFPWSVQVATSSTFKMSKVIDKPFLLEKVYIEISASYEKGIDDSNLFTSVQSIFLQPYYPDDTNHKPATSVAINNFYILNQRPDYKNGAGIDAKYIEFFTKYNSIVELQAAYAAAAATNSFQTSFINLSSSNKTNDLVTWFNILSYEGDPNDYLVDYLSDGFTKEIDYSNCADYGILLKNGSVKKSRWEQNLLLSGAVKVKDYSLNNFSSFFIDSTDIYNIEVFSSTWLGGRNGIGGTNPNGRDFVNSSKSENNKSIKSSVPYLLMPGDELSFNWQTPIPEVIKGGPFNTAVTRSVSSISFANSPSKVILYGTYLSENKGTGETLNQLLSSDAIHEAL